MNSENRMFPQASQRNAHAWRSCLGSTRSAGCRRPIGTRTRSVMMQSHAAFVSRSGAAGNGMHVDGRLLTTRTGSERRRA